VNSYIPLFEVLGIIKRPRLNVIEIILEKKLTAEEIEKVLKERGKPPTKWKEKYELVKKYILENRDKLNGMLLNDFCAKLGLLADVAPITIQGQYVSALKLEKIIEVSEKEPKTVRIIAPPIRGKNQQVVDKSGRLIKRLAELYNHYNGTNPLRIKHMLAIGMSSHIIYRVIDYLKNEKIAKESAEGGLYIDWNKLRKHLNSIYEF
jgi:DNA-binding transcriptional MerR regulator